MKYLIGIDGGGTNSRLLAVNVDGSVIGTCRGKSTNVDSNPPSVVLHNIKQLVAQFCTKFEVQLDDCIGLGFGTAGVDSEASRRLMEQMLDGLQMHCPKRVVNDAFIALYASTRGGPGVMLVSGTGSIAYGINRNHEMWRAGGFDYLLGDEGSAYWVALRGISTALHAYDRTGEPTCMLNDICKYLHLNAVDEIMDYVYSKNKSDLASLSIVVTEACKRGDKLATGIIDEAANELVKMVHAVVKTLKMEDEPYPLLLGGGFILNASPLEERVRRRLSETEPLLTVSKMNRLAEWGAVYLAAELANVTLLGGSEMEERA